MKAIGMLPAGASLKMREVALRELGWNPDEWQAVEMRRMWSSRKYGLNVARQNGKSYDGYWYGIGQGAFFGESGCICVHNDTLRRKLMDEIIAETKKAKAMGIIDRYLQGDDSRVIFSNGAVLAIRIRTSGFITGLTLDYLIVDEAQKALDKHINEAKRVLRRSANGLIAYIGTPQKDDEFKEAGMNYFQKMLEDGSMGPSNRAAFPVITDELMTMEKIPWKELQRSNPSWRRMVHYRDEIKEAWVSEDRESFWIEIGAVPKLRSEEANRKPPRFSPEEVKGFITGKGSVATKVVLSIGITADSDVAYAAMNDGLRTEIGHRWDVPYGELHQMAEEIKAQARTFSQIRISATPRGKALADMLKERQLGPKLKLMDPPQTSSNLSLMISQLEQGKLKVCDVDAKREATRALTSFWMEVHPRSGGALPVSAIKTDEALIVALANSVLDDRTAERMRAIQRNSYGAENAASGEPVVRRRRRGGSW